MTSEVEEGDVESQGAQEAQEEPECLPASNSASEDSNPGSDAETKDGDGDGEGKDGDTQPTTPAPKKKSKSKLKLGKKSKKGMKVPTPPKAAPPPNPDDAFPSVTYDMKERCVSMELYGSETRIRLDDPLPIVSKAGFVEMEFTDSGVREENGTPRPPSHMAKAGARTPFVKSKKFSKKMSKSARKNAKVDAAQTTVVEVSKPAALPDAVVREVDDYPDLPEPVLSDSYYRFIEKSPEELEDEVEYDMDEEDMVWLKRLNTGRKTQISEEKFEELMDRLEKESVFQTQESHESHSQAPIDDEAICCICMDGDCENTNVILFCDMCNLPVHQECYGVPYIPEGQWLCRRCLQSPSTAVDCCLCPNKGGAFKQTSDSRWAHVVCAIWIPEVCFANTVFLEPIDNIKNIPPARLRLTCYICKQRNTGACIQCNKNNCYTAFHVTCAQQAGLSMKIDAARDATGAKISVKKSAFCDVHGPSDGDVPMAADAPQDGTHSDPSREIFRERLRRARKILAERRTVAPSVSVPTLPQKQMKQIAGLISADSSSERNFFFRKLMAYWLLKRRARNGVPLIRRLQSHQHTKKPHPVVEEEEEEEESVGEKKEAKPAEVKDENIYDFEEETKEEIEARRRGKKRKLEVQKIVRGWKKKKLEEEKARKKLEKEKAKAPKASPTPAPPPPPKKLAVKPETTKEFYTCKKIRQDLERARLLCELIKKRERLKREAVALREKEFLTKFSPVTATAHNLVTKLEELDSYIIFAEPVNTEEVPDYLTVIKEPMDFSTMRKKIDSLEYTTIDDLAADYDLMLSNCMKYNDKDTVFYRMAQKMREPGAVLIRQAKRLMLEAGFDEETGSLSTKDVSVENLSTTESRMLAFEKLVGGGNGDDRPPEKKLEDLLEAEAILLLTPKTSARAAKLKHLKIEMRRLRSQSTRERTSLNRSRTESSSAASSGSDNDEDTADEKPPPAKNKAVEKEKEKNKSGKKERDKGKDKAEKEREHEDEKPDNKRENAEERMDVDHSPPPQPDGKRATRHSTRRSSMMSTGEHDVHVQVVHEVKSPSNTRLSTVAESAVTPAVVVDPKLKTKLKECSVKLSSKWNMSPAVSLFEFGLTSTSTGKNSATTPSGTKVVTANGKSAGTKGGSTAKKPSPRQRKIWEWLKPVNNSSGESNNSKTSEPATKRALFAEVLTEIGSTLTLASPGGSSASSADGHGHSHGHGHGHGKMNHNNNARESFSKYRNQSNSKSRGAHSDEDDDTSSGRKGGADDSSSDVSSSCSEYSEEGEEDEEDGEAEDDGDEEGEHEVEIDMGKDENKILSEGESGVSDMQSDQNSNESVCRQANGNKNCLQIVGSNNLKPHDLVWARHNQLTWFPGVLADKNCPLNGGLKGSPAPPVPPPPPPPHPRASKAHPSSSQSPHDLKLVQLFDKKRSWLWVRSEEVVPLGIDTNFDKEQISREKGSCVRGRGRGRSRRGRGRGVVSGGEKNVVKSAYERAVLHYSAHNSDGS